VANIDEGGAAPARPKLEVPPEVVAMFSKAITPRQAIEGTLRGWAALAMLLAGALLSLYGDGLGRLIGAALLALGLYVLVGRQARSLIGCVAGVVRNRQAPKLIELPGGEEAA